MEHSAFEKRVKRRVIAREHEFFAVCSPGLEWVCTAELSGLGKEIKEIQTTKGGVEFKGKLAAGYLANLCLGTPSRILMRLGEFKADHFSVLEKKIAAVDWELFLPENRKVKIQVTCRKSRLFHSDAISQKIENILGPRLATVDTSPDIPQTLMVRGENDRFQLSLDMSGPLLFKRGVKAHVVHAPLRETLAHAILDWTGFKDDDVLVDPMCGSGTFSIEAAMIQAHIPPGFFRSFAFQAWPGFRPRAFAHLLKTAAPEFRPPKPGRIFASDRDAYAVDTLRANMQPQNFLSKVHVKRENFFDLEPGRLPRKKGVILLNPPYGKRLGKGLNTNDFFTEMGKKLTRDFKGWRLGTVCPDQKTREALGLDHLKARKIFHGGLDLFVVLGRI